MTRIKNWADSKLIKFISRKLLVFVLSCFFLMHNKISGDIWAAIAIAYIGVEGFSKAATIWKHGPPRKQ